MPGSQNLTQNKSASQSHSSAWWFELLNKKFNLPCLDNSPIPEEHMHQVINGEQL